MLRFGGTAEAAVATWFREVSCGRLNRNLAGISRRGLEDEGCVFLIAFGGEADIVELNLVGA